MLIIGTEDRSFQVQDAEVFEILTAFTYAAVILHDCERIGRSADWTKVSNSGHDGLPNRIQVLQSQHDPPDFHFCRILDIGEQHGTWNQHAYLMLGRRGASRRRKFRNVKLGKTSNDNKKEDAAYRNKMTDSKGKCSLEVAFVPAAPLNLPLLPTIRTPLVQP